MRTGTFAVLALLVAAVRLHAACPDMPTFTPGHYGVDGIDPLVGFIRDLNADGKGDLVVFYGSSAGFQVFLGSATGVLTPTPLQFPGFFSNGGHALGDLNGDGKVDIAAGEIGPSTDIRLFYGVGDGTFTSGPTLAFPPLEVAAAVRVVDLDQDGLSDVVAVTFDSSFNGHLLFYRQTSPGTFSMLTVAPLTSEAEDMEVGDLDGDGKLDVAVVSGFSGTVNELNVFFGNGNGTFAAPVTVDLGAQFLVSADSIVIRDFNFDGLLDLAIGEINRGIQILRNNGNRTFSFAQLIPEPLGGSVRVADFNYDGVADLFASGYGGFYVVLANADGTFRTPQFTAIPAMAGRSSYALGDFRGLHRVDVATARVGFPHPQTVEIDLNDCGPPPLITSVTPSSGPAGGGNSVQLHGDNFFVAQQVLFGTTQATITASTPTLVTVTAPAHGPAIVPVSISTPDGTGTLNNAYAFVGPSSTSVIVDPFIAASRPFNITAIVSPPPGGGTVTFSIDGNAVGTANVVGNSASIAAAAPATLGLHMIGAQFNGVVILTPSSASVVVTVVADVPALSRAALAMVAAFMAVCGAIALRSGR